MQDTQDRELSFVIPTHRLRELGATLEEYDEHFRRNGYSVRMRIFDDSGPVNQQSVPHVRARRDYSSKSDENKSNRGRRSTLNGQRDLVNLVRARP